MLVMLCVKVFYRVNDVMRVTNNLLGLSVGNWICMRESISWGIKGLPEEIELFKQKTGNIIGYVGEWHSHPMGLEQLSTRDNEQLPI